MGTKKELSEKEEQSGLPLLKMASSFAAGVIENSRVPNLLEDIYLSGLCKTFDEADLTADLPCSFLDLLNSPHPTSSSYVNLPLPKGPLDPKLFPNVTFPQANGTYTSNEKQTGGVEAKPVKSVCKLWTRTAADSNPCGPYAQ